MTAPETVVFRLDPVVRRDPARHYVLVDGKQRTLAAMTTVRLIEAGPAEQEVP